MHGVAALRQLAPQLGADDAAAAISGKDCDADVHSDSRPQTSDFMTFDCGCLSSRIHIHWARQQRNRIIYVQSFAHKKSFAVRCANQSTKVTVARLHFAQELFSADA